MPFWYSPKPNYIVNIHFQRMYTYKFWLENKRYFYSVPLKQKSKHKNQQNCRKKMRQRKAIHLIEFTIYHVKSAKNYFQKTGSTSPTTPPSVPFPKSATELLTFLKILAIFNAALIFTSRKYLEKMNF